MDTLSAPSGKPELFDMRLHSELLKILRAEFFATVREQYIEAQQSIATPGLIISKQD
jgi:hypothetical protein